MPPVRDTVRLIHHEQPHPLNQLRKLLFTEPRIIQPLRRHQQDIHLICGELTADLFPLRGVRRVDRLRAHTSPLSRRNLITHQRQQRRNNQCWAGSLSPQQRGRHKIHGRLTPTGPLNHQRPTPTPHKRLDRFKLPRMELDTLAVCAFPAHQTA